MTSVSGWASQLAPTVTGDFLASMVGMSASARLINAGIRIDMSGVNVVLVPHRSSLPDVDVQWIAEGGAFPVDMFATATSQLGPPHKLAVSTVVSRELLNAIGGESIFKVMLKENVAGFIRCFDFQRHACERGAQRRHSEWHRQFNRDTVDGRD
jgi:hypothetical protein